MKTLDERIHDVRLTPEAEDGDLETGPPVSADVLRRMIQETAKNLRPFTEIAAMNAGDRMKLQKWASQLLSLMAKSEPLNSTLVEELRAGEKALSAYNKKVARYHANEQNKLRSQEMQKAHDYAEYHTKELDALRPKEALRRAQEYIDVFLLECGKQEKPDEAKICSDIQWADRLLARTAALEIHDTTLKQENMLLNNMIIHAGEMVLKRNKQLSFDTESTIEACIQNATQRSNQLELLAPKRSAP